MKVLGITLAIAALLGIVLIVVPPPSSRFCFDCLLFTHHHHGSTERSAATTLKTYSTAQADFRANDREGDGINQFWRADIAGLYALVPKSGTDPYRDAIKLIELSMAAADDRPKTAIDKFAIKSPKASYWFRAIRHADEDPKALDPQRFAAVAFPDTYPNSGRWTYIIDENNTIYRRDLGHARGIEVYPTDEELKQWSRIDG